MLPSLANVLWKLEFSTPSSRKAMPVRMTPRSSTLLMMRFGPLPSAKGSTVMIKTLVNWTEKSHVRKDFQEIADEGPLSILFTGYTINGDGRKD